MSDRKRVQDLYGSDRIPLDFQIIPSGTFDIVETDKMTKKEREEAVRKSLE